MVRPSLFFTCLFCMKPEDARIGVLQGTPQGPSPFFLMLPLQQLTVGDARLFKQLQAPTGERVLGTVGLEGTGLQPHSGGWHRARTQEDRNVREKPACRKSQARPAPC